MDALRYVLYSLGIGVCIILMTLSVLAGIHVIKAQHQMQIEHEKIILIADRILNKSTTKE